MKEYTDYILMSGWVMPCYWYEEGKDREEYWVDSQNMDYYKFVEDLEDEDGNEIEDTRKWYVISPFKPKDVVITEDNEGLVKWLVSSSYNDEGIKCEWDFDKHCIKEYD